MSPQALTSLVFMAIAFIMMIIAIIAIPSASGFFGKVVVLLVGIFLFVRTTFLYAYSINCMVEGNCNIFSWIVTALVIFFTLVYVVYASYSIHTHRKQAQAARQTVTTTTTAQTTTPTTQ